SLLTSTVSALSQVAGGVSPHSASASSPRGTGRPCSAARYANSSRPWRPGKRASSITTPSVSTATRPVRKHFKSSPNLFLARILPRFRAAFLPSPRGIVDKVLHCDCGFEARAEHADELVAEVQSH